MLTFGELLTEYMARVGTTDAELARKIGVRRQTVFRWKTGEVKRPRFREDVLRCARCLRLTAEERDTLLVAAGFSPEDPRNVPPPLVEGTALSEVDQPRRYMSPLAWVTVVTLLVVVIGIAPIAVRLARDGPDPPLVAVASITTSSPTTTPVPTATPSPTATPTLTATTYSVVKADETLIVIGKFANYSGAGDIHVAGRIKEALDNEIQAGWLTGVRVKTLIEEIHDEAAAEAVGRDFGATMVIWGEYDIIRVVVRFTVPDARSKPDEHQWEKRVASPSELYETINEKLADEARLLALLILAQLSEDDAVRAELSQEVMARPPTKPGMLYFRLGYLYQVGRPVDLDQAIHFYTQAITLRPKWASPYYNRGLAYRRQGDLESAIADYKVAIQYQPGFTKAYNNLCWTYALAQQPDQALPYCQQAVALDSTGFSRDSRGVVYAQLGRLTEAAEDFEAYLNWLEQQPDDAYQRSGPKREMWLQALKEGQNPFDDPETLQQLRQE